MDGISAFAFILNPKLYNKIWKSSGKQRNIIWLKWETNSEKDTGLIERGRPEKINVKIALFYHPWNTVQKYDIQKAKQPVNIQLFPLTGKKLIKSNFLWILHFLSLYPVFSTTLLSSSPPSILADPSSIFQCRSASFFFAYSSYHRDICLLHKPLDIVIAKHQQLIFFRYWIYDKMQLIKPEAFCFFHYAMWCLRFDYIFVCERWRGHGLHDLFTNGTETTV